jgi:putative nucleotidyltransferase with HDIG domain
MEYPRHVGLVNYAIIETLRAFNEDYKILVLTDRLAKHDPASIIHSFQTFFLTCMIGENMGLPQEEMKKVTRGAFLHDVGKLAINEKIMNKNGRLDNHEKDEMNKHMDMGGEILWRLGLEQYIPYAREHHIGNSASLHNGEGGTRLDPNTDIVSVADKVSAPRDPWRAYRAGRLEEIEELRKAVDQGEGKYFRREVVEALRKIPNEKIPPYKNWFDGDLLRYVSKYLTLDIYAKAFSNKNILRLLVDK